MGAIILLTLVPAVVLLLRNRPEDLGQHPDGIRLGRAVDTAVITAGHASRFHLEPELTFAQAARHRTFWILATDMALWAMIGTGIVFHALPIFQAQGIDPERSKMLFVTFSASMLLMQIAGGIMADRLPMHRLLASGYALLFAGTVVIPLTTGEIGVHLFAAFFGAGQGLAIAVNSTMWVRYYGRQHLGKIRGTVWCSTVAGSGCGPFVLGMFHDNLGSFQPGLWLFAAMFLPLIPLSLFATAPPPGSPPNEPVVEPVDATVHFDDLDHLDSRPSHKLEPMRTIVAPSAIAARKSALIPIDSSLNSRCG